MKRLYFVFILILSSCRNESESSNDSTQKSTVTETRDTSSNKESLSNDLLEIPPKDTASSTKKALPKTKQSDELTEFLCKVRITIKEKDPFCGGVQAPFERRNRYVLVSDKFVLINQKTKEKIYTSTVDGIVDLDLKPAKYHLFEGFKDVSKQAFYEEQSQKYDNTLYTILGSDCFEKWRKTPLLKFEVKSNKKFTLLEAKIEKYCFVEANPCIKYHGPLPQ